MTSFRFPRALPLLALVVVAAPGFAQLSQTPGLAPGSERFNSTPQPAPTPVPTPTSRPSLVPTPVAAPTTDPAERATALPPRRVTPTAAPTRAPTIREPARQAPEKVSPPIAVPTPVQPTGVVVVAPALETPTSTSTPSATATGAAPVVVDTSSPATGIATPWLVLAGLVVIGGLLAVLFLRSRRRAVPEGMDAADVASANVAGNQAPAAASSPRIADVLPPRAWLDITMRPIRAGTNLTSAAVDYEIDIRNIGDADATGIQVDIRLISASSDQDAYLTAVYAAPVDKPAVAAFDIPAGAHVSLGGMAMLPRELLNVLTMANRQVFVPVMSINLLYGWSAGGRGQKASAHIIGIERAGEAKMAPFRLDTGPRMHDSVGQRLHHLAVTR